MGADHIERDGNTVIATSRRAVRSVAWIASDDLEATHAVVEGVALTVYTHPDYAIFDTSGSEAQQKIEQVASILAFFNGLGVSADQLDVEFLQDT